MDNGRGQILRNLGSLSSMGIALVASILIGLAMGYYLDRWFGTKPILTLVMLCFGIVSGFRNIIILSRRSERNNLQEQKSDIENDSK